MATFDQLSQEQQAVIQLVLNGGRSYDELADMLGATPSRVRELAREALTELSPVTASRVDPEWRSQIADYVLGQQSGPESTATQGHLKRSETARAWIYSLLDSLDDLYGNGARPSVPGGVDGAPVSGGRPARERQRTRVREREQARPLREPKAEEKPKKPLRSPVGGELSEEAQAIVRRRRFIGAGIGALVLAAIVVGILAIAGAFSGSGGGGGGKSSASKSTSSAASQKTSVVGELILNGQNGGKSRGIAVIAKRGSQTSLIVQAALPQSKSGQAYVVWLFNSPSDAVSVGGLPVGKNGQFQGAGPLPANYQRFKFIDVTSQAISANTTYGGTSVLRGALANLVTPQQAAQAQQQQGGGTGGAQGGTGTGTTPGGTGTGP